MEVPYFKQQTSYTCGPSCVKMVFAYYGKKESEKILATEMKTNPFIGTDSKEIIRYAKRSGLKAFEKIGSTIRDIQRKIDRDIPVVVNFIEFRNNESHYAVVVGYAKGYIILNDPDIGANVVWNNEVFKKRWYGFTKSGRRRNKLIIVISK